MWIDVSAGTTQEYRKKQGAQGQVSGEAGEASRRPAAAINAGLAFALTLALALTLTTVRPGRHGEDDRFNLASRYFNARQGVFIGRGDGQEIVVTLVQNGKALTPSTLLVTGFKELP